MPTINIQNELKTLKVDDSIKKNINALEGFITQNVSTKLSNLLSPNHQESIKFQEITQFLKPVNKFFNTISSGIASNKDALTNAKELTILLEAKKKEIRDQSFFLNKDEKRDSLKKLDEIKVKLDSAVKKQDGSLESIIGKAEEELKEQTILTLKENIKHNPNNLELVIKLFNLISTHPLCIARYIWLEEQSKQSTQEQDFVELSVHLIKEKINNQAKSDITGSSLAIEGDITLLDLGRIKDWNNFKFNFGKRLKELRSKKNESAAFADETPATLLEKNSKLLKEVSGLKKQIASLEAQLSAASTNIQENKLITNNDNGSTSSNTEASGSLHDQNDERITELNNQISRLIETNKALTEELDANNELNVNQQQAILDLNSELENLKSQLTAKEKQIAENLEKLKQNEKQLSEKENKILKNEQALEASIKENEKLSKHSNSLSKKLDENARELNTLQVQHDQIKFQKEKLEDHLKQKNNYNDGMLKLKQEEITKLNAELKQLNDQLRTVNTNSNSDSIARDQKISSLEKDIEDKKNDVERLNNELKNLLAIKNQFKKEATDLRRELAIKSQELTDNTYQVNNLTKQFETLSAEKNTLEQNYATKLAEQKDLKTQHALNIKKLEGDFAKLQEKNAITENEKLGLKKNVDSLEISLQNEKTSLYDAEEKNKKLKNDFSTLQTKLTATEADLSSQLKSTLEEKENINKKLETITGRCVSFISKAHKLFNLNDPLEGAWLLMSSDPIKPINEEFEQILEKVKSLNDTVVVTNPTEDNNTFAELLDVFNENEKKFEAEIEDLKNQKQELLKKNASLQKQNEELIYDLNHGQTIILQEPELEELDELGWGFEEIKDDFEDDDDIGTEYKSFLKILAELSETKNKLEAKLQEKNVDLNQLRKQLETQAALKTEMDSLKKSSEEAVETISVLNDEKEKLNIDLIDAQIFSHNSELEIIKLQGELDLLQKDDSSNQEAISKLTNQIQALNELKSRQEKLISELQNQLIAKDAAIKDLTAQDQQKFEELIRLNTALTDTQNTLKESENKIASLKTEQDKLKKNNSTNKGEISQLEKQLDELNELKSQQEKLISELQSQLISKNTELQKLFDRHSVNDELITDLRNTIYIYKNKLIETEKEIETLKEKLATRQKDDSNLRENYDSLDKKLSEKKLELNEIKAELKEATAKIESLNKNSDEINAAKQLVQEELDNLKKEQAAMKDGISLEPNNSEDQDLSDSTAQTLKSSRLIHAFAEQYDCSTSSGHSSGHSSPASDKKFAHFFQNPEKVLPGQSSSAEVNEHTESPIVPTIKLRNGSNPMPRQQQDALIKVKKDVIDAFKQENHPAIIEAFTKEFSRIATHAAKTLFNDDIDSSELPDFENKLQEISTSEITTLISALSNRPELLNGTVEKIHTNGINYSTYLEEVKNSAPLIFDTLTVKLQNKADQKYKDHIADVGRDLLINLCIENLQTSERDVFLESARTSLEDKASDNELQLDEDTTETITKASQELVNELLKKNCLKNILEEVSKNPNARLNLLEASKQKLDAQLQQDIDQSFEHYFPILQLAPIFQKIKDNQILSEDEIQSILSELQYADSAKEFVSGLQVKYPHLPSDYEGKIDDNSFKNLRLILRQNALSAINQTLINDNEIIDLNAEAWLEKKLQLKTGKSINLKLDKKQQKNLDNEFNKSFPLSPLEDIAITHKSVDELSEELKKLDKLKSQLAIKRYTTFSEIDTQLAAYPHLIDEDAIDGFVANLNIHLSNLSVSTNQNTPFEVNNAQATILLAGIEQYLKNNTGKWNLFHNKLAQEVSKDILANNNQFGFDEEETYTLITNALKMLDTHHRLKDTLNKREKWETDIKSRYAFSQNLESFSQKLDIRVARLENMSSLKQDDANNPATDTDNKAGPSKAVYLPHRCPIIADSANSQLADSSACDFKILGGAFYKQNALKIGQELTFKQKIANNEERIWSVTRINETCLTYKTHKPWLDIRNNVKERVGNKFTYQKMSTFETSYGKEVSFAQMIHGVNSFKEGSICTLQFGKYSSDMKKRLLLFVAAYNELRNNKGPILLCDFNPNLKMQREEINAVKNEIKDKLKLHTHELNNANNQLSQPVDASSASRLGSRG